jgi:hypothetical protein
MDPKPKLKEEEVFSELGDKSGMAHQQRRGVKRVRLAEEQDTDQLFQGAGVVISEEEGGDQTVTVGAVTISREAGVGEIAQKFDAVNVIQKVGGDQTIKIGAGVTVRQEPGVRQFGQFDEISVNQHGHGDQTVKVGQITILQDADGELTIKVGERVTVTTQEGEGEITVKVDGTTLTQEGATAGRVVQRNVSYQGGTGRFFQFGGADQAFQFGGGNIFQGAGFGQSISQVNGVRIIHGRAGQAGHNVQVGGVTLTQGEGAGSVTATFK